MPGMDGPTTLKALRENPLTAGYPVIFMTAKVQSHEVARYVRSARWASSPSPLIR